MSEEELLLAVAGDNTKTDVSLLERDGTVRAAVRGPGASPDLLGVDASLNVMGEVIERTWAAARMGVTPRRAGVGMYFIAGVNAPAVEARVNEAIVSRKWSSKSRVLNDVFASLWAANGKGEGVAVFVGAGINCVGQLASGSAARFACLGPLSGDSGDGHSLATAAIAAAVRAEDGRGSATALTRTLAQYFGRSSATEVALAFHDGEIDEIRLLDVVPLVIHAAAARDGVAEALLDRQAAEVVRYVTAAARRLHIEARPFDVILSGSMMDQKWSPATVARVRERLATELPKANAIVASALPIVGAALATLAEAGAAPAAAERIRAALVAERLQVVGGAAFLNLPGQ